MSSTSGVWTSLRPFIGKRCIYGIGTWLGLSCANGSSMSGMWTYWIVFPEEMSNFGGYSRFSRIICLNVDFLCCFLVFSVDLLGKSGVTLYTHFCVP